MNPFAFASEAGTLIEYVTVGCGVRLAETMVTCEASRLSCPFFVPCGYLSERWEGGKGGW